MIASYKSQAWKKASEAFRKVHYLCQYCYARGLTSPTQVTDHIRPHGNNPELFWDVNNWQPLCKTCHDHKSSRESRGLKQTWIVPNNQSVLVFYCRDQFERQHVENACRFHTHHWLQWEYGLTRAHYRRVATSSAHYIDTVAALVQSKRAAPGVLALGIESETMAFRCARDGLTPLIYCWEPTRGTLRTVTAESYM